MSLCATSGCVFLNSSFIVTPFRPLLHGNQMEGASWAMLIGMKNLLATAQPWVLPFCAFDISHKPVLVGMRLDRCVKVVYMFQIGTNHPLLHTKALDLLVRLFESSYDELDVLVRVSRTVLIPASSLGGLDWLLWLCMSRDQTWESFLRTVWASTVVDNISCSVRSGAWILGGFLKISNLS